MVDRSPQLSREEYIEQAYLYRLLRERVAQNVPMQELLEQLQHEVLATTKLPMAINFLLTELKHTGLMSPAMRLMSHYFTPFQSYVIEAAESETGRLTMELALRILQGDADYRCGDYSRPGVFFYQFEALSRNRLSYDRGLTAMSGDPVYDDVWSKWVLLIRAQVGLVDMADLVFLASDEYKSRMEAQSISLDGKGPFLFGDREGRISLANRRKDPVYLFGALQRHLAYPKVPRPIPPDPNRDIIPQLSRRIERLESRILLMEQEQKATLDISKFYKQPKGPQDQF